MASFASRPGGLRGINRGDWASSLHIHMRRLGWPGSDAGDSDGERRCHGERWHEPLLARRKLRTAERRADGRGLDARPGDRRDTLDGALRKHIVVVRLPHLLAGRRRSERLRSRPLGVVSVPKSGGAGRTLVTLDGKPGTSLGPVLTAGGALFWPQMDIGVYEDRQTPPRTSQSSIPRAARRSRFQTPVRRSRQPRSSPRTRTTSTGSAAKAWAASSRRPWQAARRRTSLPRAPWPSRE